MGAHPDVDDEAPRPGAVLEGDFIRRRAEDLDAQAVYYRHRAIQEERALGPGYYVELLRSMATDRTVMAERIRHWNGTT